MKRVRNCLAQLAAAALGALAAGAPADAAPVFVPLAHSSLVTVDAATTDAGALILRVRRMPAQAPLTGARLQVTLDGRSLAVRPRPDGTWEAALGSPAAGRDRNLEITVAHDGLREVLSGRLSAPAGTPAPGGRGAAGTTARLLQAHKQLAWWILNIAVVLIGVIAVSRRMS